MRYEVKWQGVLKRSVVVQVPADAAYHVWSRYRDEFTGGSISVEIADVRGVMLAKVSFPVSIVRVIEAEDETDAVRSFLYDDRLPEHFDLSSIRVLPVEDGPGAEPVARVA